MAYDKPLKMQWIEVDGRTVPLVLPQYWSDEQDDWVVSSEQNRLPVDAQLTGSRIELGETTGMLEAGSKAYLHNISRDQGRGVRAIDVVVSCKRDERHDFEVSITYGAFPPEGYNVSTVYEVDKDEFELKNETRYASNVPLKGNDARIRVQNNDVVSHEYFIKIWGRY